MTQQPYIVGKFYRVPCVYGVIGDWSAKPVWWPVIGPKHEDAAFIGFPDQHYHVDVRFVPEETLKIDARGLHFFANVLHREPLSSPVLLLRKCKRQYPPYPHIAGWFRALQEAYANKTLTNRICPHRGADLSTFAPDEDGCITCPLHGLRWDAETGKRRPVELPPDRREAFRKASAERHGIQTQGAQQ